MGYDGPRTRVFRKHSRGIFRPPREAGKSISPVHRMVSISTVGIHNLWIFQRPNCPETPRPLVAPRVAGSPVHRRKKVKDLASMSCQVLRFDRLGDSSIFDFPEFGAGRITSPSWSPPKRFPPAPILRSNRAPEGVRKRFISSPIAATQGAARTFFEYLCNPQQDQSHPQDGPASPPSSPQPDRGLSTGHSEG